MRRALAGLFRLALSSLAAPAAATRWTRFRRRFFFVGPDTRRAVPEPAVGLGVVWDQNVPTEDSMAWFFPSTPDANKDRRRPTSRWVPCTHQLIGEGVESRNCEPGSGRDLACCVPAVEKL